MVSGVCQPTSLHRSFLQLTPVNADSRRRLPTVLPRPPSLSAIKREAPITIPEKRKSPEQPNEVKQGMENSDPKSTKDTKSSKRVRTSQASNEPVTLVVSGDILILHDSATLTNQLKKTQPGSIRYSTRDQRG